MAQQLGTFNINKDENFPGWYEQILIQADIVDKRYPVKGMPVFMPYGYFMHNQIMTILEKYWDELSILKAQFPTLIPESFLTREAENFAGFSPECFWVTKGGDSDFPEKYALRPTSETAMYATFSNWVRSFRDLPLKVHQTCSVFRYETKSTLPLIRAREIYWNEGHTCHETVEEALQMLEDAWAGYLKVIHEHLCVYGLRLRRPTWDQFAGAEHTDVMDAVLPSGKVLQIVGAHYLGQKFAKPFDIKFLNRNNEFENAYMTCFGVSTRLLAAALSAHGDSKGLIVPPSIAPYQVVIVPIVMKKTDTSTIEAAKEWKKRLFAAGIRATVDDSDKKPGEKYYFWEMKGVPVRVEIGPRDLKNEQLCVVRRDNGEKSFVPFAEAIEKLNGVFDSISASLRTKQEEKFKSEITTCTSLEEVKAVMEKGGFARIPFCAGDMSGKDGDQIVHDKTGGEVRGYIPTEEKPAEGTLCIATGRPATVWGYVARAY